MSNMLKLPVWGREFDLNVIYQNYPGETVTDNQKHTLDTIPGTDLSEAINTVEQYIRKYFSDCLEENDITNIFKYVIPKTLLIPREEEKIIFAIMCNFKFDMEHGIAIVFEEGKCKAAGPQDIIL